MNPAYDTLYQETLTSRRTFDLFAALTYIAFLFLLWRFSRHQLDGWGIAYLIIFLFFLFSTLNYRTLIINLSQEALTLKFGLFTWMVPVSNIISCQLDDHLPPFMRYGGAGVHFMFIQGRYRVSFNFLEYPRVVVAFKRKVGPVVDISFSTKNPEEIIRLIQSAIDEQESYQ